MSGLPTMLESTRRTLRHLVCRGSTNPELQVRYLREVLDLPHLDFDTLDGLTQHDAERAVSALSSL